MATILGLDIDPQHVRGVVLRTSLRKSEVVKYVSVPIAATPAPAAVIAPGDTAPGYAAPGDTAPGLQPAAGPEGPTIGGASPEPTVDADAALRTALRSLLAQIDPPPDKVITELSGDEVSIRKVTLPVKAAKKLDELLPFELEGKVPFEIGESVIDHQPIETVAGELKLLAAVAPKDKIRKHLEQMRGLGLEPREVAVGAVALDGLVPLTPQLQTPGPHCLIDIHMEGTDVCILQNGACHFARTVSVSVPDIDERDGARRLDRELKQTLAAWRMEGGVSPSTFYVCGQMAVRHGTDEWLSRVLGAPVEVLPMPSLPGSTEDGERPAFARAAALAGRALNRGKHLNARQDEFAAKQTVTAIRQHVPLIATCAAVVVGAFVFSSYARYSVLEARHQQLEDELGRVTEEYLGVEARSPDQALTLLARGPRGNDPMPRFDAYDALEAISAAVPEDVTHDVRQLQIDLGDGEETGRFTLRGVVDTVADAERIRPAIDGYVVIRGQGDAETRLDCFHEVELVGNTSTTAEDRRSYRLEGDIHCEREGAAAADEGDDEDESASRRRRKNR